MNYLVTGCMGSMGRRVVRRLLDAGHEVVGTDLQTTAPSGDNEKEFPTAWGDLCDSSFVQGLFSGARFDCVIHLAAVICGGPGLQERRADALGDNLLMTANLLRHGAGRIGRFAYVSSSMVYEMCEAPHREDDVDYSRVPRSAYGLSKYVGEELVKAHHAQRGQEYVIWRPFNVVDPEERARGRGVRHVIPDLIEEIVARRADPVTIIGDGRQVRCFTHVDDVVRAIADFSARPSVVMGHAFNLGCDREPVTVLRLAEMIHTHARDLGLLPMNDVLTSLYLTAHDMDVRRRVPDITKAAFLLDWRPEKSDLDGIIMECLRARFGL